MEPDSGYPNAVAAQATSRNRTALVSWRGAPRAGVALLLVHIIFEYLRLHQIWPILGQLKVQTVIFTVLLLIVIAETARGAVRLTPKSYLLLGSLD